MCRMDLKSTRISKCSKNIGALNNMLNSPPVILLIEKIARLLPILYINIKPQAIFINDDLCVKRIGQKPFLLWQAFQLPYRHIVAFINSFWLKNILQGFYN